MNYLVKIMITLAMGLSLSACINLAPSHIDPVESYTLDLTTQPNIYPATHKTVMVNIGQTTPRTRSNAMTYQQNDYQLKNYALHRWLAPPISMITPILATQLSATQAFKAVVSAPIYAGSMDYQISLELEKLQQNFSGTTQSKEIMAIEVVVIDMKHDRAVASKLFSTTVDADPTPKGGVVAANKALAELMPQMIAFIMQAVQ